MILYKYVDSNTADLILSNSTLRFSKASSLNDPFELTSLHYESESEDAEQAIRFVAASDSYGILSLTRNPLNPLMWAHYAKGEKIEGARSISLDRGNSSHAGFVFGIDADAAGLNDHGSNVIPAKFGSVIYTSTKPKSPFIDSTNTYFYQGLQHIYQSELLEALQRTFLYKPAYWSYEEEVRVVRNVHRHNTEIQEIDKSSIKEIYLGFRNSFVKNYLIQKRDEINAVLPHCKIYVCGFDPSEWTFNKLPINEAIHQCLS